jgi:two-component system sensor histidine kinase TctE
MRGAPGAAAFWARMGLRRTLLLILLPSMLVVAAGEAWLAWRTAVGAADAAYDRSLLGAIKAIDANISTESGGIGVELPYRMLEFFELTASGNVYFRIATEDGLVELGNTDLPPPPKVLPTGRPQFADAIYVGERVRIGSYARPLSGPGAAGFGDLRIVIQVAESVASRSEFTRRLVIEAISRDLLLIAVGGVLLTLLVTWALSPLRRLRREVLARAPDDLTPIEATNVPRDVAPLVDAINHHVLKSRELAEQRRRFVDDASHQLRTPLATLATQMTYALRETDPQRVLERCRRSSSSSTKRSTDQPDAALARADTAASGIGAVDL